MFDRLLFIPAEYCIQPSHFSYGGNELMDDIKERLKLMDIQLKYYCSMGNGCLVQANSDDLLSLTLMFEGLRDEGPLRVSSDLF